MAHFAIGCVLGAVFFGAFYNGRVGLMLGAAALGLGLNALVSGWIARRDARAGMTAAVAFGGSALGLALFSLGDLFAQGDARPILFWLGVAGAAIGAGLLSVVVFRRARGGA